MTHQQIICMWRSLGITYTFLHQPAPTQLIVDEALAPSDPLLWGSVATHGILEPAKPSWVPPEGPLGQLRLCQCQACALADGPPWTNGLREAWSSLPLTCYLPGCVPTQGATADWLLPPV